MSLRQAAQRALKVMDDHMYRADTHEFYEAKEALRAALAEPQQEPDGISWLKRGSGYFTAPTPRKPLTDEMVKRMKEVCTSMEMRGAFADGWLSAEAAHGIGEQQ